MVGINEGKNIPMHISVDKSKWLPVETRREAIIETLSGVKSELQSQGVTTGLYPIHIKHIECGCEASIQGPDDVPVETISCEHNDLIVVSSS